MAPTRTMANLNLPIHFIDTPEALDAFRDRVLAEPGFDAIGLDTEFIPEKRYRPLLCLVQVATRQEIALVDAIAVPDLSPMQPLLEGRYTVVLHSGMQDIPLLRRATQSPLRKVFDTQVAASLCGPKDQIGYGDLVEQRLGVKLRSNSTVSRWDQRPLDEAQLAYAADDVKHLLAIYDALRTDLDRRNRMSWAEEEFARVLDPDRKKHTKTHPRTGGTRSYRHLPQTWKLSRVQLAVLRELWDWRQRQAAERDLSPKRVVGDHVLMAIATACPQTPADLCGIRHVPKRLRQNEAVADLLVCVKRGTSLPPDRLPDPVGNPHLSTRERVHLDILQAYVRHIASQADIAPTVLAQNDLLRPYIQARIPDRQAFDAIEALTGWRREVLAEPLFRWLVGDVSIRLAPAEDDGPPIPVFCTQKPGAESTGAETPDPE